MSIIKVFEENKKTISIQQEKKFVSFKGGLSTIIIAWEKCHWTVVKKKVFYNDGVSKQEDSIWDFPLYHENNTKLIMLF